MPVYIDNYQAPYRGMKMCHMVADSTEELLRMVDRIKVQRKWIQKPGTVHEHFDVCLTKRTLAVENGAIEVSGSKLAHIFRAKRLARV